jgi:hypothetical protein
MAPKKKSPTKKSTSSQPNTPFSASSAQETADNHVALSPVAFPSSDVLSIPVDTSSPPISSSSAPPSAPPSPTKPSPALPNNRTYVSIPALRKLRLEHKQQSAAPATPSSQSEHSLNYTSDFEDEVWGGEINVSSMY